MDLCLSKLNLWKRCQVLTQPVDFTDDKLDVICFLWLSLHYEIEFEYETCLSQVHVGLWNPNGETVYWDNC